MDITLVVAAGNEGRERTLDTLVPQVYGTDDRFTMITVGGVDKEGKYYIDTVQGNGQGGVVDIYAGAVDVSAASPAEGGTSYTTAPGTSLAAPAIVYPPPLITLDKRLTTLGRTRRILLRSPRAIR